jgi:hypothetical protein
MTYSDEDIQAVWAKGNVDPNNDPDAFRKDRCGAWIAFNQYGSRKSPYGWEIDHIDPHGGDDLRNLRPLQWENNASKQDGPLKCVISAHDTHNVRVG